MSGGVIFDLYALAFAALVAGTAWLTLHLVQRRMDKPHDWAKEWPEFRIAKDAHVKQLP